MFGHFHHHHFVPQARISLTLSFHFSLSFIASGRCSRPHPVSSHCCRMYVRAGRPIFARPYVGVHRSTSLMGSSLFLQQCPICKVTHEPITRIISKLLDIKQVPFTQEEFDSVLRKIKNRKAAGLDEILPEVWRTRQFDDTLLRHCNAVYHQNPRDIWMKGCILPFPKTGDLGLAKNYQGITLTCIEVKIYNALLRIEPKIDNILRENQNGFRRNRSTTSQILTISRILEGVRAKNLQATLPFVDFTKLRFQSQRKDGTNPTSIWPT